jgi:hypothetical protein
MNIDSIVHPSDFPNTVPINAKFDVMFTFSNTMFLTFAVTPCANKPIKIRNKKQK